MQSATLNFVKPNAPDSPFERAPHGWAKCQAAETGISDRTFKMAWRLVQLAPDLGDRLVAGTLSLVAANRQLRDRLDRATRQHRVIVELLQDDPRPGIAALVEASAPDCAARLRRWWLVVLAADALPQEGEIAGNDPALVWWSACVDAAVKGLEPLARAKGESGADLPFCLIEED